MKGWFSGTCSAPSSRFKSSKTGNGEEEIGRADLLKQLITHRR